MPIPELSTKLSKNIKWPIYRTPKDFEAAGSKLKKLLQLVQYHLDNPSAPQIKEWSEVNNDMAWPNPVGKQISTRAPKILAFFHFAAMENTIVSVS